MDTPQQYTAAETERMMKLQDVLLKAMAKKMRWWDAAEIIGLTDTPGWWIGVAAKDNTVAIADRTWQLEKSRFRNSLAGCTVTIHQHLDRTVSIRFGPHIVGRYTAEGQPVPPKSRSESRGKDGPVETVENRTQVSHRSHRSLGSPKNGIPPFPLLRRRVLF